MNIEEMEKLLAEAGVNLPVGRRVLFVDDEQEQLDVLEPILEGFCRILTATSGAAALDMMEKEPVDVVIADHRMPGMTGVELLERVMTAHPYAVRIILTAYSDTDVIIQAINRCAVYRFILKPWEPAHIRHTIASALEYRYVNQGIVLLVNELRQKKDLLMAALVELRTSQEKVLHADRLATIGKFAASVSHDLRNELFIIMGAVSIMKEMKADEKLFQMIELESQAIENLYHLATGIYDYSKIERGDFSLVPEDVNAIISEAIGLLKWRTDLKPVTWDTHLEPVPPWPMNKQKMMQLLINLLLNAADSVAGKKGRVDVFTRLASPGLLQIEIRDNGRGIPADLSEKVWKPFFTTKDGASLGLGLDICRQITEIHGGNIYFRSTSGSGTSFFVDLPAGSSRAEAAHE